MTDTQYQSAVNALRILKELRPTDPKLAADVTKEIERLEKVIREEGVVR